jgi:hypothetical protein
MGLGRQRLFCEQEPITLNRNTVKEVLVFRDLDALIYLIKKPVIDGWLHTFKGRSKIPGALKTAWSPIRPSSC